MNHIRFPVSFTQ